MPQSLANVLVHLVFSTKERRPCLDAAVAPRLHAFLAEMTRSCGCECYRVGGTDDHVHLAVRLARTVSLAALVEEIKVASSKWLETQGSDLADFAWQRGYGAFSVAPDGLPALIAYIDGQPAHHRKIGFQTEYRQTLADNAVAYDERWVWE